MALILAGTQLTLLELAKRHDPDGGTASIVEVLQEENEILHDAPWLEANDVWSHKTTRRVTLPTGAWRQLNAGVPAEASRTREVREGIGMLESYAQADKALVDSAANPESFRNSENVAFIEGLAQTLADTMIYGNATVATATFDGLAPRMGALAALANVIGAGSAANATSIYVVQWGPSKVHMIYPRGHKAMGIDHRDLGEETNVDAAGNMWQIYRDWFGIKCGMVVRDERCIGRIANINTVGAAGFFDEDDLITLLNRMPNSGKNSVVYVNTNIITQMEILLKDKANVNYTAGRGDGLAGEPLIRFRGSPVRKVDQIINAEAVIV